MKIRTAGAAALVAASVLTALAPSQALAAQAPPCTKKNIAYLDAQNAQDDAEAKVTAAEQALDRARADRAKLDKAAEQGSGVVEDLRSIGQREAEEAAYDLMREAYTLSEAAQRHDPAATADASVKMADALDKAVTDHKLTGFYADGVRRVASELRTRSESVRAATEAPNVEVRQSDLDKARTELTSAHQKVRPARDTYRKCLDNLT